MLLGSVGKEWRSGLSGIGVTQSGILCGLASWVSSWECLYECYVGTVGLSSDVGLVKCVV